MSHQSILGPLKYRIGRFFLLLGAMLALTVCLGLSADAFQLTPTRALGEDSDVSDWTNPNAVVESVSESEPMDFLNSGELPTSVDQLRAMQVRFKSLAEQIKDATVSITMRTGQGTGVLVSSDGLILTAAHVISGPRRSARITFRDGSKAWAVTLGVEAGKDSGMLKILEMIKDDADQSESTPQPSAGEEASPEDQDSTETDSKGANSNGAKSEEAPGELPAPQGESLQKDAQESSEERGTEASNEQKPKARGSKPQSPETDLITRAFAAKDLPIFDYLDVGVSADLDEGQWVMAVGHPGGLDEERGMVVRVGRIINRRETAIRTDCTLVGGDSGGPLVDMQGNLVAIHSRIGGRIQDNIHVPVDVFSNTWEKLAGGYKIGERGRLGLSVGANSNIVSELQKGGPADKGGVQVGDIISAIEDQSVTDKTSLSEALSGRYPGEKLTLKIIRGSQKLDLGMTLVDQDRLALIKRFEERRKRLEEADKP